MHRVINTSEVAILSAFTFIYSHEFYCFIYSFLFSIPDRKRSDFVKFGQKLENSHSERLHQADKGRDCTWRAS